MTQYVRCPEVLWRQGPDRVLVRSIGGEALDLIGAAAMVWLALDTPRTITHLVEELDGFGVDATAVASATNDLLDRGLLQVAP